MGVCREDIESARASLTRSFKKELIATAEGKLPHCLGTDYAEAALKCLNRELETRNIPIQSTFFIEIVGVLGRCARSS